MKKIFTLILLTLTLAMLGCGSATKAQPAAAPKEEAKVATQNTQGKKILVAYYSASGTTKAVAEKLAKAAKADLFEIVPEKIYSNADLNYHDKNSRCSKEHADRSIRPAIKSKVADMKQYDVVFVGYPIWWGDAPNIVYTFMESYDFSGKTMVPFCTVYSCGFGSSDGGLKKIASKAKWLEGADLTRADVNSFVAKLKL